MIAKVSWMWLSLLLAGPALAGNAHQLDEHGFDRNQEAVVILQINWGRYWPCAAFENAQLQALTFTRMPYGEPDSVSLELKPRSNLRVDNKFLPYAYVLPSGEYALSAYDVKRAKSVLQVDHEAPSAKELIPQGKPIGGSFSVASGEVVYIGSFGLDCTHAPIPWRYYVANRAEFEGVISRFRKKYPEVADAPAIYRLFSTHLFGEKFSLENPIVKP